MKKKTIILITILLITLILSTIYLVFFNPFLNLTLKGKEKITLEVNTKYKEPGAIVKGTKNKYKVVGKVNTNKLGKYTLTYKVTSLKTTKKKTRTIKIVDTTKPVINLTGDEVTIYQNEQYQEPGYTVTDNYDKDLTEKVIIENNIDNSKTGEYTITYKVTDSSKNTTSTKRKVIVKKKETTTSSKITYINGILLVNKKYSLPSTYNPGVNQTAYNALKNLQKNASAAGFNIPTISGFRSYTYQKNLYNKYVAKDGQAIADTYSARPGHSEHQSGLAFDVGAIDDNYGNTPAGKWLTENCHKYGFIIRYLKGKEDITGYKYEPWHIRYVGVDHATKIHNKGITLEEYLGVN